MVNPHYHRATGRRLQGGSDDVSKHSHVLDALFSLSADSDVACAALDQQHTDRAKKAVSFPGWGPWSKLQKHNGDLQ